MSFLSLLFLTMYLLYSHLLLLSICTINSVFIFALFNFYNLWQLLCATFVFFVLRNQCFILHSQYFLQISFTFSSFDNQKRRKQSVPFGTIRLFSALFFILYHEPNYQLNCSVSVTASIQHAFLSSIFGHSCR